MENVVKLKNTFNSKLRLGIATVILNENLDELTEIIKFAKKIRVSEVFFTDANLKFDIKNEIKIMNLKRFQFSLFKAKQLAKEYKIRLNYFQLYPISGNIQKFKTKKCLFLWNLPNITWDGFLTPCCALPYPNIFNFGNVFKNSFKDLWKSKQYLLFRESIVKNMKTKYCNNCPLI